MMYIVGAMAVVFVVDLVLPDTNIYYMLSLDMSRVKVGEIWRLVTFIFLPPSSSVIWIIFSLYFYWMIGSALEAQWGAFRFNLYYLTGILGSILAALITGYSTNTYLNLSLYLAFAILYPNFQLMLFFVIPVKVKYLALLSVAFYVYMLIVGDLSVKITIILSLINVILFFGGDIVTRIRQDSRYWKTRYQFRRNMKK